MGQSIVSVSLACLVHNCGDLLSLFPGDVLVVAVFLVCCLIGRVVLDPVGTVEDNMVDADIEGLLLERFGRVVGGGMDSAELIRLVCWRGVNLPSGCSEGIGGVLLLYISIP